MGGLEWEGMITTCFFYFTCVCAREEMWQNFEVDTEGRRLGDKEANFALESGIEGSAADPSTTPVFERSIHPNYSFTGPARGRTLMNGDGCVITVRTREI